MTSKEMCLPTISYVITKTNQFCIYLRVDAVYQDLMVNASSSAFCQLPCWNDSLEKIGDNGVIRVRMKLRKRGLVQDSE